LTIQPRSQQVCEICHGDRQVLIELLWRVLVGSVGYGADFERAEAVEESRTCRAAAFPRNARGPRLIADNPSP
jgi:hypothetical protein